MSKNKKFTLSEAKGQIPELRFPEFKNEGEWEIKEFSKFIKLDRGSSPRPIQEYLTKDESGVNWIKIGDTKNALNSVIYQVEEKITSKGAEKSRKVEKGELILANSMSFGKTYKLAIEGCIYDGWFVLRKYENHFYKSFLLQLLNSNFMQNQYKRLSAGGIVQNISSDIVYNSKLFHTTLPEQQKIASCLSSLDEVITAHGQKLELLKDHKKGLMQNLFPQEGKRMPKYRFKEFENDGDWVVEKKLKNLGHFLGGGTPGRSNSNYWIGNIPWISSSDIGEDDIHNISITRFVNANAIKESATKIIPKGSVLFVSRVGVGKLAISKEELCTSQDFTSFVPKKDVLNFFIGYYFSSNKNLLQSLNQGTSIKGFSKGDLENFKLPYPKNPKEQQKIASSLSSLDELITVQAEKIEQLKQHKKGLMQGLFPKMNN